MSESQLEIAQHQVAEAETDIERQKLIIAELEKGGHPAAGAHTLLRLLEQSLHEHREALSQLKMSEFKVNPHLPSAPQRQS